MTGGAVMTQRVPDPTVPDVFSFTVEVGEGSAFEWAYFGPNSAVLFGGAVSARELTFDQLLLSRCLSEDLVEADALLAAAAAGGTAEAQLRMQGVDGAVRWISWRVMPRRVGGRLALDGVATDVSSRRLGRTFHDLLKGQLHAEHESELVREHAAIVRDANDGVLQRLFAAGLRLRMLQRSLDDVGSHAAEAIAFQLDQASADLRHTIRELDAFSRDGLRPAS
jgi:signal transduction histidine kinase